MAFVHLQVASAYDLLSSTASIDGLIQKAKEYHYPALAITDKNALYGACEFYTKCKQAGIKPIIGMTVEIPGIYLSDRSFELMLLAETTSGYQNLLKIASSIKTHAEKEELPLKWLNSYKEGLIAISPGITGEIERLLHEENQDGARQVAETFQKMFGGTAFYLSLEKRNTRYSEMITTFAEANGYPAIASKNVRYLKPTDVKAYRVLTAIRDNETIDWTNLETSGPAYFASPEEVEELFQSPFEKEALAENGRIAARCQAEIALHQHLLPRYPLPPEEAAVQVLKQTAYEGLKLRGLDQREYIERLDYELDVIAKMGFADYFLIVWDVMRYARKASILTGPGRGSAAGSLVAYVLQITDVDPILYNLLFERFLNPERVTMPDIDLDFPDNRRDEVIQYVVEKYGPSHVAQIGTFGTLAAKAAIRDTARTFGLNTIQLSEWSKQIPNQLGITLQKAYQQNGHLQAHIEKNKQHELIWEIATAIEGLPRHISTHAAGVIISDRPLVEQVPLQTGSGSANLTQFAMGELEQIGLLKMDFLGLRNLSLLDRVIRSVNFHRHLQLTPQDIPLNDALTLELFRKGDTTGVFQFESDGIRRVLRKLGPTSFEDIVAVDALYRPGPMEQIDTFIARKHGKEATHYPHPDLKPILEVTYGVIVYQEQIMQVASQMAGFSLGEADLLRRAVSKKKREVLNEQRAAFVSGAHQKGYSDENANEVYDLIVQFANYGFNRSHAAAYSKIAFQLAYMKAHFPAEFMAALLGSVFGNDTKMSQYIAETKKYQLKMAAPSINKSQYGFVVEGTDTIRYSFRVIRKLPNKFILALLEERKNGGPFKDFYDFCERIPSKQLTQPILESLIYAGCFDEFGLDRAVLIASIDGALDYIALFGNNELGLNLFADEASKRPRYREVEPMPADIKLEKEKEFTGQYVSSHPVLSYQAKLRQLQAATLMSVEKGKFYAVGFYVHEIRTIRTKKGELMAFLTISDDTAERSAVVFPDTYRKAASILQKGALIYAKVKADERNGELQLVLNEASLLKDVEPPKRLYIRLASEAQLEAVKQILLSAPGKEAVIVHFPSTKKTIALQSRFSIRYTEKLGQDLSQLLGSENVIRK
ncbi:DNA polymerase III subunit alpha [Listeria costaricensis]|uniref:DNA polymerase III subunit alpha n=1 Tax=Listeria costaricensis TaxID=2026604 RepID=UPI000C06D654|nr:DNA polymerase III subunit alpha [Listeria costaricensis]